MCVALLFSRCDHFFALLSRVFFGCTYVPWLAMFLVLFWLQVTRDGLPQLVIVSFPCVLVLLLRCTYYYYDFVSSIETFFVAGFEKRM